MKSISKNLYGHSIKNLQIKHLLIHKFEVITNEEYITGGDKEQYLCMGACGITPEKSTWNIEEVTCKNCLKTIKKGIPKGYSIYNGELWETVEDCGLPEFCNVCNGENGPLCAWTECPYKELWKAMKNGFKDYPESEKIKINHLIKEVSVFMKEGVYKEDSILLILIFPILCFLVGLFITAEFVLNKIVV